MAWEIGVQSQVDSYQKLNKWYSIPPCLTLSIITYGSRVKWSNTRKEVALSPTPWCSSCWKGVHGSPSTTVIKLLLIINVQYTQFPKLETWNKPRKVNMVLNQFSQIHWDCRIHWLLLGRGIGYWSNKCPEYNIKQPDGKTPVWDTWGMLGTSSLPSILALLRPGVVAPDRVLSNTTV